jgi:hypothetical protein
VRARPPFLVVGALVLQAIALAYVGLSVSKLERALDRPQSAPVAEAPHLAPPPAPTNAPHPPSIAKLDDNRVVYAVDGKIVVLAKDPRSQELLIEHVYSLEHDETQHLGDDAKRAYSGFYLVDVERARKEEVETEDGVLKEAAAKAANLSDGLELCLAVARKLADAGGIDRLAKRLDDRNSFARQSAALALGERGYVVAIPQLVQIVEATGDSDLARRVILILRDLTGIAFDPSDGRAVVAKATDEWWKKNAPEDRFARRPPRTP